MASHPFSPLLEELPAEILARIFGLLDWQQLSQVEAVSRRCRSVVVTHELWLSLCVSLHPAIAHAAANIDASAVPEHRTSGGAAVAAAVEQSAEAAGAAASASAAPTAAASRPSRSPSPLPGLPPSQAVRRSAFFKRLSHSLRAPLARESLVAAALGASSTDHPQETVANVLDPIARSRHLTCYWSSRGSQDEDSNEALLFQLAHPLCLVTEVLLRPFRAFFQWGAPIYAPKAVRFRLGGIACFAPDGTRLSPLQLAEAARADLQDGQAAQQAQQGGDAQQQALEPAGPGPAAQQAQRAGGGWRGQPQIDWVWESDVYPVLSQDEIQEFDIPPTLCVGGCLRVELLGKRQRQAADDAYYACVCYVRALGTPIYNFHMRPLPGPPASGASEQQQQQQGQQQQDRQPPQQPQPQGASGSGAAGGSGAACVGSAAMAAAAAAAPGTSWELVYTPSDLLLEAGGLVAVSEGGRLLRHGLVLGEEGLEPAEGADASDTDGETEDIGEMAGDLDAMADVDLGAVNFAGFPPQALPWAAPPVQGPGAAGDGVGGGEGSSSEDGGDSGSDSDESEGGESSSSDGGSTSSGSGGEAMDEDEEDEWFPGGDAGAY